MDTTVLVTEEEYLSTSYEPDCEYEDGVLIERNVGERDHSWLQLASLCLSGCFNKPQDIV